MTPPATITSLPSPSTSPPPLSLSETTPNAGPSRRPKVSVQQLCQTLPSPPTNCKRLPPDHIEREREFNEMGFGLLKYDLKRQKADEERAKRWAECPPLNFGTLMRGPPAGAAASFFGRQRERREVYDQIVLDQLGCRETFRRETNAGLEAFPTWQGFSLEPQMLLRREHLSREEEARGWEADLARQYQEVDQALERLGRELSELESEHSIDRRRPLNPLAPPLHFRQPPGSPRDREEAGLHRNSDTLLTL